MTRIETLHFAQGIGAAQRISVPAGSTVAQIAASIHGATETLTAWVRAPSGHPDEWIEIPRAMWGLIKPKINSAIAFGYRLAKDALKSILSIAAAVLVAVIAPYLAPIIGPLAAGLVSAAVGIGAQLALNALFPTEQTAFGVEDAAKQFTNVESGSNVIAKESYLPIGINRRLSPPEIAAPFAFLENGIQTLQRIFALSGHHSITDVQVDGTPVEDFDSITTEIKDGAETTGVSTFIDKVTKSVRVQESLSSFTLDEEALVDQDTPSNSEPRWVRFSTASDSKLEEISIRLQVQGFAKTDDPNKKIRVPLRIRFREKGSEGDWFHIPEIHMVGRDISTGLKEIRLRWDGVFGEDEATGDINYQFFQRVPSAAYSLSDGSTGDQWQAESHFVSGSKITATQNIQGRRNGVRITLDETLYPKIEYEFEVKRGLATRDTDMTTNTYLIDGAVQSLFRARLENAEWVVPVDQGAYLSNLTLAQVTSIVNRQPCQRPGTALLAIKSVGQSMTNVTAHVDRMVHDWDGSGWNTLTTTKNPATHFRQVLFDYLNYHGINTSLIDNDALVGWRAECADKGYEVSAAFAGATIKAALDAIAVAGYARRVYGVGYGVDWFRDRSGERPVQSFSPRNAMIGLDWISGERPAGIRTTFQNEDNDFVDDEIQVNNPFYTNTGAYVVSKLSSISNPVLAERRTFFNLLQSHFQGRRQWTVETAIEGLVCERGNLVALVSDLVSDDSSGARIREVINANTFRIDQDIPAEGTESIFDVSNIFDEADIFKVGAQSVCMFSTPTGTELRTIVAASGDVIRVDTNLPSTDLLGAHIAIGPTAAFTSRCIVQDVERKSEEMAMLTCVDEAPEIHEHMTEKYG